MNILLIEDDKTINQNIKDALVDENYSVTSAFDGLIALKLLKSSTFDCIILDINLPNKNGFEICTEFRSYNKKTPVLMLTAYDELEDKMQGFDVGADDYLTKPFYMKEILARVKSLINRSQNSIPVKTPDIVTYQDLVINQQNKTVFRNGIEITVTPREYQILLRLCEAKGGLVAKKDLVEEIWGNSFDANTNTIEVFINFLRKKIDKPFKKQLIKTKVGFGYYLDK